MGLDPAKLPAMPSQAQAKPQGDAARKTAKGDLTIPTRVLASMIDKTIFAVSPDEARYNLGGVLVEAASKGVPGLVATDGHRLSMIEREAEGFEMEGNADHFAQRSGRLRKLLDQEGEEQVQLMIDGNSRGSSAGQPRFRCAWSRANFPTTGGNSQAIEVCRRGRARRAAERDQAGRDFLQRGAIMASSWDLPAALDRLLDSPEMGEASETIDVDFTGEEFSIGFQRGLSDSGPGRDAGGERCEPGGLATKSVRA